MVLVLSFVHQFNSTHRTEHLERFFILGLETSGEGGLVFLMMDQWASWLVQLVETKPAHIYVYSPCKKG